MYEALVKKLQHCSIENCRDCKYRYHCDGTKAVIGQATDAIEDLAAKYIPMKVIEIHVDKYYCPNCGAENSCDQGRVQDNYCPVCGHRIFSDGLLHKEE